MYLCELLFRIFIEQHIYLSSKMGGVMDKFQRKEKIIVEKKRWAILTL